MHQKLASWKADNLPLAGGITSCRSVLAKIPSYPLQAALLHKLICSEIERICRGFIWADSGGRRGRHLIKWKAICKPKEEGGLGICDVRTMNKAFTMKLVWGLLQKSDSLCLWIPVLRSKYVSMGEGISQLQAKRTVETVEEGEAASTYFR
jgi:hypothetical protein